MFCSRLVHTLALILLPTALLSASVFAQEAKKARAGAPLPQSLSASGSVATVNGVSIPATRAEMLLRERAQQGGPRGDENEMRAAVREELINREVVMQEAARSGLTKRADIQTELELVRQTVIVQSYLREHMRTHPITDAEIQKEYERIKADLGDKEYKARHILVGTEEEARNVIAELKKGTAFEEIAKKSSRDEGTKERGGDLEWNAPGGFDKDFATAMVKLSKGKFTDVPVKTRFGFHVIQLDDTRTAQHPPIAEVRANLQQRLQRVRIDKVVSDLRAKAKVE